MRLHAIPVKLRKWPRQQHYYSLNHLHCLTANIYRRGHIFDSELFNLRFIRRLKLGAPRSEVLESNGMLYKLFRNGVVVANPNDEDRELHVKTGFTFLREVLTNHRYAPHDESKAITLDRRELQAIIPARSGRVFIHGFSN